MRAKRKSSTRCQWCANPPMTNTLLQILHMRPTGLRDVPWCHCNSSHPMVSSGSWPESSGSLGRTSGDGSAFVNKHIGHLRIFENMIPPRCTGPLSTKSLHVYVLALDSELLLEPHLASAMATQQHTGTPTFQCNPLAWPTWLDQQQQISDICPKQSDSVK